MADEELLSQQEIDALLDHTDEDSAADSEATDARPYQLGREQHTARGRLPTLEMIAERFSRSLAEALRELFRLEFEVGAGGVDTRTFSDYCSTVVPPISLTLCRFNPIQGSGLVAIDATLVHGLVDLYFGGTGADSAARSAFSPTERRIVAQLKQRLLSCWDEAWSDILSLRSSAVDEESNPHLLNAFGAQDLLTCVSFSLSHEALSGTLMLALPYKGLEAHRSLLDRLGSTDGDSPAIAFKPRLAAAMLDAVVPVRCQIATAELRLKDLMAMKVGDVIDASVPDRHWAYVGPVPVFDGALGESSGKLALELKRGPRIQEQQRQEANA